MRPSQSITGNIITKAILPFVLTLLLFSIFSCKKEDVSTDDPFVGTYSGVLYTCSVGYTPGGNPYPTTVANPATVTVSADGGGNVVIDYRGGITVELAPDSSFTDTYDFTGAFYSDSLRFKNHIGVSCEETFRGKKQ